MLFLLNILEHIEHWYPPLLALGLMLISRCSNVFSKTAYLPIVASRLDIDGDDCNPWLASYFVLVRWFTACTYSYVTLMIFILITAEASISINYYYMCIAFVPTITCVWTGSTVAHNQF